jgi:hypothetical protein
MLSVIYALRRYTECRYAECRHAEFHSAEVLNGKRLVVQNKIHLLLKSFYTTIYNYNRLQIYKKKNIKGRIKIVELEWVCLERRKEGFADSSSTNFL